MSRRDHRCFAAFVCAYIWLWGCGDGRRERVVPAIVALDEARSLVGLDEAFALGHRGQGITVATLDTGIDPIHGDLAGAVVGEACFCSSNCCPGTTPELHGVGSASDDHGHGTHMAGIIASRGVVGPRGGAPEASLVAVKVLDSSSNFCCVSDLVAALNWIGANHPEVRVVNMSLALSTLYAGHCDAANPDLAALATAIAALRSQGVLVVAPSGNEGVTGLIAAPACIESTLAVGAVWDQDLGAQSTYCADTTTGPDQIACFSNVSNALDVLAPGARVTASWPGAMTRARAGTSESAAVVSACAAAVWSAVPTLSVADMEGVLRATGAPVFDARVGAAFARIDCAAAIDAALALDQDAGFAPDAGEDAGTDAVVLSDAATPSDAAVDAAAPYDAAMAVDGGIDGAMPVVDAEVPLLRRSTTHLARPRDQRLAADGCTCNQVGYRAGSPSPWAWGGALALLYWQSKRWRTRRSLPVPSRNATKT